MSEWIIYVIQDIFFCYLNKLLQTISIKHTLILENNIQSHSNLYLMWRIETVKSFCVQMKEIAVATIITKVNDKLKLIIISIGRVYSFIQFYQIPIKLWTNWMQKMEELREKC